MQILKMLTRLRQLCLEPRLVYDNIDQPSSKLKACMELIKTMQENKQKVLLFSSFTSALDLIAEECQKAGITYYMLTGSTNKEERRELVSRFQKDNTTLFLISLKAGGTGLNLFIMTHGGMYRRKTKQQIVLIVLVKRVMFKYLIL